MITLLYGTLCGVSLLFADNDIGIENVYVYGPLYYICSLCFNFIINSQYIRVYNKKCEISGLTLIINTSSVTTIVLGVFMLMLYVMGWYKHFNMFFKDNDNIKEMKSITLWFFFTSIITSLISLNVSLSQQCIPKYEEDVE
jgi:hypothetical protein